MHRVVVDMQMSSVDVLATVITALEVMPDVTLEAPTPNPGRHLVVTIHTDDADLVDIVREIAWQFDPLAIQHSVHLADVG